jgi:hypothetical protein
MVEISQRAADNKDATGLADLTREMARMAAALENYYHALQAGQRHLIPRYLKNMYQYQASGTSINLAYQSQMTIRITGMLIVVSSAGTLQIGSFFTLPVTPGMIPPALGIDGLMVEPGQSLTLTQASAGQIGIWCMGQEMASEGKRW